MFEKILQIVQLNNREFKAIGLAKDIDQVEFEFSVHFSIGNGDIQIHFLYAKDDLVVDVDDIATEDKDKLIELIMEKQKEC